MKKSRLIAAITTVLVLILSTTPIASGDVAGKSLSLDDFLYQKNTDGIFVPIDTIFGLSSSAARFYGSTTIKGPDYEWSAVFQPCSTQIKEHCIESVSWRKTGSAQWKPGTVTDWKPSPTDPVLAGITYGGEREIQYRDFFIHPETGLPRGGHAKVWSLAGANHAGGDDYLVTASMSYFAVFDPTSPSQVFGLEISPVRFDLQTPKPATAWPFGYGTRYNFPNDIELQIKVRMGKFKDVSGGWFNGRILDPYISEEASTLTLSGEPTKVLAAHTGLISCENTKTIFPSLQDKCGRKDQSVSDQLSVNTQTIGSSIENATKSSPIFPNGTFGFFEPLLKPIGFTSEWNALAWGVNSSGNCKMDPGKIALVSSNATLYSVFPPIWDPVEQSLAYKVGSLHLDHTGALHKGHFNLAVPKNFAKCLWGQNILNAKATVAVTNADGTNNVATSVLSQDNQMIYFKVAGFTFSTPQIKVKLITPKGEQTPSATIKPTPVKKTITCVKGKITKKVTALTPKCPAGYKKK